MQVRFSGSRYPAQPARRAYIDEALRRVEALPGVRAVEPLRRTGFHHAVVEGAPPMTEDEMGRSALTALIATSAGLRRDGLRLIAGRWITDWVPDARPAPSTRSPRDGSFPGRGSTRRRLGLPGAVSAAAVSAAGRARRLATVVGVVADLSIEVDATLDAELYAPYA